jgi:hypothetical protein
MESDNLFVGTTVRLVGKCYGINAKLAHLVVINSDNKPTTISMNGPWPTQLRNLNVECPDDKWGAEVIGFLRQLNGSYYLTDTKVVKLWKDSAD